MSDVRAMRHMQHGFPEAVLEPGDERTVKIELKALFRPSKLFMVGSMKEIRGHFKVKRSRLPLLNRDDVVAYTQIKRRASKRAKAVPGRTVIEYRGRDPETGRLVKSFVRSYLPSSVVYEHTDPLSYVELRNLIVGTEPQMPAGVQAFWFGSSQPGSRYGNGLSLPSTEVSVAIVLKNVGDVRVRVLASIMGYGE